MSTDSERSQDYADVLAAEVLELDAAIVAAYAYAYEDEGEPPTFDGEVWTDPMDVLTYYFDALALEVLDVTARSWGYPDGDRGTRRYVEVLRTFGGPNARVRFYGDGRVEVSVHWGSDEAKAYAYAPTLDNEVQEYADAYAAALA
jgi:hypothetical protein